ncbi:MFS transporter [Loigolactobacillus binensis]|uniref:MFS transporter n=1 Tax=Loigolactobacillus binensis TaxID=2559922 RepID=A0ABW3EGZ2_9LACO|nr:MFS transporter [Loigolactobacillus binensis]
MKKRFIPLAAGIYVNYAILGMATIIISQYSSNFQRLWHTNVAGISTVIAMIGIGRLVTVLFAGALSDRLGRKPTMLVGMGATIVFLLGLAFSTDLIMAAIFALFLGVTNSFDDASSYPALTDAFGSHAASMNSLNKAAMSLAQFVLPFIVALVPDAKFTLVVMALVIVVDILCIIKITFAPQTAKPAPAKQTATPAAQPLTQNKPSMAIDGSALIVLGFTISFTFYIYSQYVPNFGITVLGLNSDVAKGLISWYASSSLISVFITSILVTKIRPLHLVLYYSTISLVFLLLLVVAPSLLVLRMTSIVIGFFAAGGIWQLGLTVLTQYFPLQKGKVTGYYSFATALTYFVGPFVSSFIINDTAASVLRVFQIDVVVTLIGVAIVIGVLLRNRQYHFV